MRIAFYGGSFNPPHYAHFLAATWALCSGEVERVWMAPCYRHAFGKKLAPYEDRLEMCRLGAAALAPAVEISDCERRLDTIFTVDTLAGLQELFPQHRFRLLVGSDILDETEQWREFDRLVSLAPLLVAPRGGYQTANPLGFALPRISSSRIRSRLRRGLSVEGAVPPPIIAYIEMRNLYRD